MTGARHFATALLATTVSTTTACARVLPTDHWTCDFDASETRPLADPDAEADDAGLLAPSECQDTCGPPASSCTRTVLDGGQPGAVCPVCTF